ncbi:MAG: Rne/Rng family ribonuclease [Alphaproteobacteria bacterium]
MSTVAIDEILISVSPGETRAALVAQGRLIELAVERAASPSLAGSIYLGRVGKLAPGMAAAFIELGAAGAGFLARDDAKGALDQHGAPSAATLHEGEALVVQVAADAVGGKGPRLTGAVALPGHAIVYTPAKPGLAVSRRIADVEERSRLEAALRPHLGAGDGFVVRTAAAGAQAAALLDELAQLRALWQAILARAREARAPALLHADSEPVGRVLREHASAALRLVLCDGREAKGRTDAFLRQYGRADSVETALHRGPEALLARHDIDGQIAEALEPVVALPSGGSLAIGTLEALSAIDVNSARQGSSGRFEEAALAVNLEAADEIARQVRLRNLAGLIVIDFLHTAKAKSRARVGEALAAAFAADPVPVELGGFTRLGLFEMTRKRVRASLQEVLGEPCAACRGSARLASAASVAYEVLRAAERAARAAPGGHLRVVAAEAVIAALEGEAAAARRSLERQLGRGLALTIEPSFRREQFDIVTGGSTAG